MDNDNLPKRLCILLKQLIGGEEDVTMINAPVPENHTCKVGKSMTIRTCHEFQLDAKIWKCEVNDVMLVLGSYVNIFPWDIMEKPSFLYSPSHSHMTN